MSKVLDGAFTGLLLCNRPFSTVHSLDMDFNRSVGHIITVTTGLSTMSLLGVKFDKCLTSETADWSIHWSIKLSVISECYQIQRRKRKPFSPVANRAESKFSTDARLSSNCHRTLNIPVNMVLFRFCSRIWDPQKNTSEKASSFSAFLCAFSD